MSGDERRTAGSGRLGGDHAERLGEDRRHHAGIREREQVPEVAVLERAGEQRLDATVGGERLERARSGPKPTTTSRASIPASASIRTWTPFCSISLPK